MKFEILGALLGPCWGPYWIPDRLHSESDLPRIGGELARLQLHRLVRALQALAEVLQRAEVGAAEVEPSEQSFGPQGQRPRVRFSPHSIGDRNLMSMPALALARI